jgi:hypothetical protein
MCLNFIDKSKTRKAKKAAYVIGWKVFRKVGGRGVLKGTWRGGDLRFVPGKLYLDAKKGPADVGGRYRTGFHAYLTKEGAKKEGASGWRRPVVHRVRLRKIMAVGHQNFYPCVVGRSMYICKNKKRGK